MDRELRARGPRTLKVPFLPDKKRFVMTIPWGDVSTAWYSTGIPNIEVYMAAPLATRNAMRLADRELATSPVVPPTTVAHRTPDGDVWLAGPNGFWKSRGARTIETVTLRDALLIGTAQALALIPGVSRSGIGFGAMLARTFGISSFASLARSIRHLMTYWWGV